MNDDNTMLDNDNTDLKQRMREFLDETAGFYNSRNRCVDRSGYCFYRYEGKACAIGRKIPAEIEIPLHLNNNTGIESLFNEIGIPDYFAGMSLEFLKAVQNLHDKSENWDENGLSLSGEFELETIRKTFKL